MSAIVKAPDSVNTCFVLQVLGTSNTNFNALFCDIINGLRVESFADAQTILQ